MSWLSSIIGNFTGSSKKKGIINATKAQTGANNQAIGGLNTATTQANDLLTGANTTAVAGQNTAAQDAISRIMEMFGQTQANLSPYVSAGTSALGQAGDFLGLNGSDAQAARISQLQSSPLFASLMHAGNENILQSASATGGLRGGNAERALAELAPNTLAQLLQQHLSDLGGISGQGLNAGTNLGGFGANAAGTAGNIGTTTAANIAGQGLTVAGQQGANTMGTAQQVGGILRDNGAQQANSILGRTAVNAQTAAAMTKMLTQLVTGIPGGFGGGGSGVTFSPGSSFGGGGF